MFLIILSNTELDKLKTQKKNKANILLRVIMENVVVKPFTNNNTSNYFWSKLNILLTSYSNFLYTLL